MPSVANSPSSDVIITEGTANMVLENLPGQIPSAANSPSSEAIITEGMANMVLENLPLMR